MKNFLLVLIASLVSGYAFGQYESIRFPISNNEVKQNDSLNIKIKKKFITKAGKKSLEITFLFDTLGDDFGVSGSYWVLIVMPLMPLVSYVVYEITVRIVNNINNSNIEREIEIATVENPIRESDLFVITIS